MKVSLSTFVKRRIIGRLLSRSIFFPPKLAKRQIMILQISKTKNDNVIK